MFNTTITKKLKRKRIDTSFTVLEHLKNLYITAPFNLEDTNSYRLCFGSEYGYTKNGKKECLYITAEYINIKNVVLVKFSDENFDTLLDKLKKWCKKHRVYESK